MTKFLLMWSESSLKIKLTNFGIKRKATQTLFVHILALNSIFSYTLHYTHTHTHIHTVPDPRKRYAVSALLECPQVSALLKSPQVPAPHECPPEPTPHERPESPHFWSTTKCPLLQIFPIKPLLPPRIFVGGVVGLRPAMATQAPCSAMAVRVPGSAMAAQAPCSTMAD